jgi:hypothetical protein
MSIDIERRDSSTARVPAVEPGHAIVFTRYDEDHTVVLEPGDFRRLAAIDGALDAALADRPEISELVSLAHRLEDEPGEALEDAAAIRRLLAG